MAQQAQIPVVNLTVTETEARHLDAAYKPFPSFVEWSNVTLDNARWDRYTALLAEHSKAPSEQLDRARAIAVRAAAVDTGAIEGLYDVDRGFTFTVAMETAAWEAAIIKKGEEVRSLIESQLNAYDYVVDLATKAEPITEAAVRTLHAQVVAGQKTYRVVTSVGFQEQPLPKGEYKLLPNHVRRADGKPHAYAPADVTTAEMHRLVEELRSEYFLTAHPILQASYAHYSLVAIHPFSDGNGRVARALASVFLYRARSIPFLVLVDQLRPYFAALEAADQGYFQGFIDFTLDRALEAMQLVRESILAGVAPRAAESLDALRSLYVTKGGYTHEQVDHAGGQLLNSVLQEISLQLSDIQMPQLMCQVTKATTVLPPLPNYRTILRGENSLNLSLTTKPPANAVQSGFFQLQVPKDCGREDDLLLYDPQTKEKVFNARIDDLVPSLSSVLQIRIKMFAEGLLARRLAELARIAGDVYRKP